ncbi:polysaccharide deacetylase family protein [Spirosoma montaniterrae]|uniref:Polysaccharide deacetylase n=1 Tax=Spirosoma montaniterrae TaxID=1178516 RepID=A0A1P9WUR2_9BACT|nr:polysaccharide deacetylase family protein [Spirosoma montaniterrae]AQG79078.1 polysaccharide deacetylase [Spirosoma montaniterrae]
MRTVYPEFWWKIDRVSGQDAPEPTIYLTFDDGPIPDVTEFVLEQLDKYAAQATFFCIGDNVRKHRNVLYQVLEAGHMVGNHTYNHLNGWKTDDARYLENIQNCQDELRVETALFRPPYGRIKKSQAAEVMEHYSVIMWDVLTGDFNQSQPADFCLRKTIQHTEPGSIVVFHDSLKAWPTMRYVLPRMLAYFSERGYSFRAVPQPVYAGY